MRGYLQICSLLTNPILFGRRKRSLGAQTRRFSEDRIMRAFLEVFQRAMPFHYA